jgi:hypothetical protein
MTATRERELRFDAKMSDAEALMWTIEKDPWLNPSGAMVSVLNQPLNFEAFRIRINNAVAVIPRLRERVVPGFGRLAPPTWQPLRPLHPALRRPVRPHPSALDVRRDRRTRGR